MKLVSNEPGPRFFPYVCAGGIALFSILAMIFDGRKEAKAAKAGSTTYTPYLDKKGWIRLGVILLEALVYALCMKFIGFWITAMVGTFVFIYTLKGDKKINIIVAIIVSICLGCLCYFGFTRGFHIPLPKGTLWNLLGINMP